MSTAPVRRVHRVLVCLLTAACVTVAPAIAAAQNPPQQPPSAITPVPVKPIPWLVFDARGAYPSLGRDEVTAAGLRVASIDLPGRARTLTLGAHAYPLRRGKWKVGVGAEWLMGSGLFQKKNSAGTATGPAIHRRLNSLSGQVSLNFGRGAGWSYLTAGSGPFKFESYLNDAEPDGVGASTLNFGGGARWFKWDHLAFTVDLRFYLTKPANPTLVTAGRERARVVVFSAGISLK